MKIEIIQPYQSIHAIEALELPDFAVLIGRNGAGKTQLLEALKIGNAQIAGIGNEDIELFNMGSFSVSRLQCGNSVV